jgi:hypothetical protein
LLGKSGVQVVVCEERFHSLPTAGEVVIRGRKRPERMKVIGEKDECEDIERVE